MTDAAAEDGRGRCPWATGPWLVPYHDEEWGVPVHDDRRHFEHLTLEGAQAGLSWLSVLKRRDGYRQAFAGFDPAVVAGFNGRRVDGLMGDAGIIRNRRKIESVVANAAAFCQLQEAHGSFSAYLWGFVDGQTLVNRWRTTAEMPAKTALSEAIAKDLRRRGFRFVGPTVCYSHLQATGLVMDHLVPCFRYGALIRPG
ncbi:MAG: DNA-3-methyladenine glycosylase I [Acidimicrobiales bacterium]